MKKAFFFIIIMAMTCSYAQTNQDDFKLSYLYAALGSGMGSKQPVLRVEGNTYLYTMEQNSHYGEKTLSPDTICTGIIRGSSIDSILNLISVIKDTLIYNMDASIMSGGIHELAISSQNQKLNFRLHNASNPIAENIVSILNSNLPGDVRKLWLFSWFSVLLP